MNSKILPLLIGLVVLASCGSSKKFQASYSEDKPLYAAINALKKKPGNERAQDDLQILYKKRDMKKRLMCINQAPMSSDGIRY